MTWFKVDDGFAFHPKAIAAGNASLGLWVRAGAWCSANLTDGALPRHMIGTFGAQKRDAARLVAAGLWCETDEGYQFTGWTEWQPTKEQVNAEREATKLRQQAWRDRKRNGVTNGVTGTVTNGVTNTAPTRPDPTRSSSKEEEAKTSSSELDAGEDRFEEFWKHYPRREAKQDARKAWAQITKNTDAQTVIDGLTAYAFSPDRKFIPLGASWLRGRRWEDEKSNVLPMDPHAGKVRMIQLPSGRWREVSADEVTYGKHTEWRVPS